MDLDFLKKLNDKELDELQHFLNNRKKMEIYEANIQAIKDNQKYIGKCYFDSIHNRYIRILSSKSTNRYRLEAMCFDFPVSYHKKDCCTMIFNPDNAFGNIEFEGFYVEDIQLLGNGLLTASKGIKEISEEEYFSKMDRYYADLKEFIKADNFNTANNVESMFKKN